MVSSLFSVSSATLNPKRFGKVRAAAPQKQVLKNSKHKKPQTLKPFNPSTPNPKTP